MIVKTLVSPDQIDPAAGIHIYGCGEAGRTLRRLLEAAGRRPVGFVDSTVRGTLEGLPVVPVDALVLGGAEVLVACSSFLAEIRDACARRGISLLHDAYFIFHLHRTAGLTVRLVDDPS